MVPAPSRTEPESRFAVPPKSTLVPAAARIVPSPPHGGVLQRGFHILRQLGRRAEVHLLAFVHQDELPTPELVEESRRVLGESCVEIEYFPLWAKASPLKKAAALAGGIVSPRPFSTVAHRSPAFQQRVDAILASGGIDLVHVDTIALNRFLGQRPDVPTVLTHHNIAASVDAAHKIIRPQEHRVVSLLLFFRQVLDLSLGLVSILVAHVTFSIGFVAVIVRARLAGMDESIFEAARDLGATPWRTFRLVTLPLIMPGVIAGALMAFTLSIDDFVITFFTAGPGATTLPLRIYSMIKHGSPPLINALSTLLLALTTTTVWLSQRLLKEAR